MRLLVTTVPPDHAPELGRTLVEERLVACVNTIAGVESVYPWKGEICRDREVILLMETADDRLDAAMNRLRELHPYECPKIVAIDPLAVYPAYAAWVNDSTH